MDTKKVIKYSIISLASVGAVFGIYKGVKYLKSRSEAGGGEKEITLADGTKVTVSSEKADKPDSEDISNLSAVMLKWVNNKRITVVNQDKLLTNAKKLTKYEVQNFIYLLDKGDPTVKAPYGLTTEEAKRLIALIKNIALLQKNK